jgi:hypothetical protein
MWVIFRDPKTPFNHIDKFVLDVVAEEDILAYQKQLTETVGGRAHEIHLDVYFIQQFFTSKDDVEYFARRYKTWRQT